MEEIKKLFNETKEFNPAKEFDPAWVAENRLNEGIGFAQKLGFDLCNYYFNKDKKRIQKGNQYALSNSQIRNVFGEAKRIQMKVGNDPRNWENEKVGFTLLKPKLAYAAGRSDNRNKIHQLRPVLDQAIDAVEPEKEGAVDRMNNFVQLLEAILAYHRAYGGN